MKRYVFDEGVGIAYKHYCGACGTYFDEPDSTRMREDEPSWSCCPACGDTEYDNCIDLIGGEDD